MSELSYRCQDCGWMVHTYLMSEPPNPPRCMVCRWVAESVAPEFQGAVRSTLSPAAPSTAEPEPRLYTCPTCHSTSYNLHDAENRYCGACHAFADG